MIWDYQSQKSLKIKAFSQGFIPVNYLNIYTFAFSAPLT